MESTEVHTMDPSELTRDELIAEVRRLRSRQHETLEQLARRSYVFESDKAEETTEASEDRFRLLAENATDLIYRIELKPAQRFSYVSPSSNALTGYTPEEHYADPDLGYKLVHPDDRQKLAALASSGVPDSEPIVIRWVRKDGTVIWTEQRNTCLYDESGELVAIEGIARDITARKEDELRLEALKHELEETLNAVAEAVWKWDLRDNRLEVSDRFFEMLGHDRQDLALNSASLLQLVHPDDAPRVAAASADARTRQPDTYRLSFRLRSAGGEYRFVRTTARVVERDPEGNTVRLIGSIEDVTQSETTRGQLESVLETSQALVCIAELTEPVFRHVNDAVTGMLGYTPEEFTSRPFYDFLHPDDIERTGKIVAHKHEPVVSFKNRYRHKDGSYRWLIWNMNPRPELKCSFAIALDITREKEHEDELTTLRSQLDQAMRVEAIGHLAGGIAHDFNNKLSAILGNIELVKHSLPSGHRVLADLLEAEEAAQQAAGLTRQLLGYARRQTQPIRHLDIHDELTRMSRMLGRLVGDNITLTLTPANGVPFVRIDPTQLDQIVMNLVINARDAIAGSGEIRIETSVGDGCRNRSDLDTDGPSDAFVKIAVIDSGSGIEPSRLNRIFEPFFTTKQEHNGTGLGLSTVAGIVEEHGGHLRVESAPGMGSRFEVFLPAETETPDSVPDRAFLAKPPGGTETILLVEDEPSVLQISRRFLERAGYCVLAATNPTEATDVASERASEIDLILSDMQMPGMNGIELLEGLASVCPRAKGMLMSGYAEELTGSDTGDPTNITVLRKPFTSNQLLRRVREILDQE